MSPQLYRTLETCIDSRDKLELVLAIRRSPTRTLAVADLAPVLRLPPELVRRLVASLQRARFVDVSPDGYVRLTRFTAIVDELATLYERSPAKVLDLLTQLAVVRLRALTR